MKHPMFELETPIVVALITGAIALFAILANHRLLKHRESNVFVLEFAATIQASLAALSETRNSGRDAFEVLETHFPTQHRAYLAAIASAGPIRQIRLRWAWKKYFGPQQENDPDWWLPNEYGTVLSNKSENSPESTRRVAIDRLKQILTVSS